MKTALPNLVRALLSALLTIGFFAVVEGGLGLFGGDWSELYTGDPGFDWRVRPNLELDAVPHREEGRTFAVTTNELGMRDDPVPASGPWVLALGCSTTFGWGVEHDHVWTEVLQSTLGMPVVNAGVPGHSSEQGKRRAAELIELKPDLVILGWGLRDGQHTMVPDIDRKPARFPRNTRLYRMLAGQLAASQSGSTPRVSESQFRHNLKDIVSRADAAGVQVILLDMTGRSDTPSHGQMLQTMDLPLVVPDLTDEHHFPTDRIHLNVLGNQVLAMQLTEPIETLLGLGAVAPPPEPVPQQTP